MGNIPKNRDRDDLFEEFTKHARKLTIVLKSASSNQMKFCGRDEGTNIYILMIGCLDPVLVAEVPGGSSLALLHYYIITKLNKSVFLILNFYSILKGLYTFQCGNAGKKKSTFITLT